MDEVPVQLGKREPLKVGNKVFKSAYDWTLTEEDVKKAYQELGEREEKKKKCLQELKEKLLSDSSIKYRLDDDYLLRFLRFRKYDVKRAYQNVRLFMDCRRKNVDFIILSPDLKSVQELNIETILPYTDEERRVILLTNLNKWNPEECSFDDAVRTIVNVLDMASMNPSSQINGIIAILDFSGITLRHVSEILRSGRMWSCISCVQTVYPWRIKKVLVLNTNALVRTLYNIVKPILSRKLTERIVLLGADTDELHKYVNPVLLPKSLNGTLEDAQSDTSQFILNNVEYLRYERSFGFRERNFLF